MEGDLIASVHSLKREKGGDIVIFGSGEIIKQLAAENLIAAYVLCLTPVVLGEGKSFFRGDERTVVHLARGR